MGEVMSDYSECEHCGEFTEEEINRCSSCLMHYCNGCGDSYITELHHRKWQTFICYECFVKELHQRIEAVLKLEYVALSVPKGVTGDLITWIFHNYSVNHIMNSSIIGLIGAYRICRSKPAENPEAIVGEIIWITQ